MSVQEQTVRREQALEASNVADVQAEWAAWQASQAAMPEIGGRRPRILGAATMAVRREQALRNNLGDAPGRRDRLSAVIRLTAGAQARRYVYLDEWSIPQVRSCIGMLIEDGAATVNGIRSDLIACGLDPDLCDWLMPTAPHDSAGRAVAKYVLSIAARFRYRPLQRWAAFGAVFRSH